jgi:AcrR family transcriptional regulator
MVYRHVRRRGDKASPHPTRERILDAAVEVLGEAGLDGFSVDEVLRRCEVTSGALYHHFVDVPDLLEQAIARRFPQGVLETIEQLRGAFAQSTTLKEYQAAMRQVTTISQQPDNRPRRVERAHYLALAFGSDALHGVISEQQRQITDAFTVMLTEIQDRGWLRSDVDPRAVAVFLQAYTLGRIVDDVTDDPLNPEAWNSLINTVMLDALSERSASDD